MFFSIYCDIVIVVSNGKVDEMQKAIFSRVDLNNEESQLANEFINSIKDIINVKDVQDLKEYAQHFNTSRFQHSLNVSYYTFLLARKFNLDAHSAARAGLLHDLYLYDWRKKDERPMEGRHSVIHPQVALENAKNLVEVNEIMEDAILHHMWPMSFKMPKTKEGWLLQAVDKYCAVSEMALQSGRKLRPAQVSMYLVTMLSFIVK